MANLGDATGITLTLAPKRSVVLRSGIARDADALEILLSSNAEPPFEFQRPNVVDAHTPPTAPVLLELVVDLPTVRHPTAEMSFCAGTPIAKHVVLYVPERDRYAARTLPREAVRIRARCDSPLAISVTIDAGAVTATGVVHARLEASRTNAIQVAELPFAVPRAAPRLVGPGRDVRLDHATLYLNEMSSSLYLANAPLPCPRDWAPPQGGIAVRIDGDGVDLRGADRLRDVLDTPQPIVADALVRVETPGRQLPDSRTILDGVDNAHLERRPAGWISFDELGERARGLIAARTPTPWFAVDPPGAVYTLMGQFTASICRQ
jgi:hypothetical protein